MDDREFLRHALATLAYRAEKAVRGVSPKTADFAASGRTRRPVEILAHMGDLLDWGLAMTRGEPAWREATPLPWEREVARFFAALQAWDDYLASGAPIHYSWERLFQGPIADALTHVGQINLLRGVAGERVLGESYNQAPISVGRVGRDQDPPPPGSEFPA